MNYRIVCNTPVNGIYADFVLMDYTVEGRELSKAVLTRSFNGNLQDGQLVFTIHPGHYAYDKIKLSLSTITVYDGDTEIFRGRPVSLQTSKTLLKTYTCEHMMKFMIDVPDIFSTSDKDGNVVINDAITAAINGYNAYAADNRKIYLPSTFTLPGKAKAQKGSSVYSNLSTWLSSAGYYAKIAFLNNRYELSFSTDTGVIRNDFAVVFGENVLDYLETVNIDKLYTAVYPVGVDSGDDTFRLLLDSDTGVTPQTGYTIDPVKKIIRHTPTVNSYGLVVLYVEVDLKDATKDRQTLYDYGVNALKNAVGAQQTFSISAVDPRLVNMGGDTPIEGCYYPVSIPLPTNETHLRLMEIVTDMTKPSAGSLSFGGTRNVLTDQTASATVAAGRASSAASGAQQTAGKAVRSDYVLQTGNTGIWTFEKWHSGKAVCWGTYIFQVTGGSWTQDGSVYSKKGSVDFPSNLFAGTPKNYNVGVIADSSNDSTVWVGHEKNATKTTATFTVFRHNNLETTTDFHVTIFAIGSWKNEVNA